MPATILEGNVFDMLPTIPPGSVDCVVTSPPYWMLRSYLPKGHALKPLELGSEPTPAAFVENMVKVFRLVREAMADHATCWVNIGDTYAGSSQGERDGQGKVAGKGANRNGAFAGDLAAGNLCLIPQRLAIALQDDGWIVRSVVVWHKPAPMPASLSGWAYRRCRVKVKDGKMRRADAAAHRPRLPVNGQGYDWAEAVTGESAAQWSDCPGCDKCRPHGGYVLRRGSWRPTSAWEPILMLAKTSNYYADGEAVKQPSAAATVSRNEYSRVLDDPDEQFAVKHDHETTAAGANLRDVWTIAAEPLRERHYASFPTELVWRCLRAGTSSRGYCVSCGLPWCRVLASDKGDEEAAGRPKHQQSPKSTLSLSGNGSKEWAERGTATKTIDWRPSCSCPPTPPRAGLVLDPFAGSGRTLLTARRLGLDAVGVELNPSYVEMARRLLYEDAPLFA